MSKFRILCAALFVAIGLAPAVARNPERVAITPQSENAALILKAELLEIPRGYRTSYRLGLQQYDPEAQRLLAGPFGGQATFAARRNSFVDGYMVIEVPPGTYVFRDINRQDYWSLCFHDDSRRFTVRAGEVVYLGELDVRMHIGELETMSMMTGRTTARSGEPVQFFEGVTAPAFKPVGEAELAAVTEWARTHMPRTTVAPRSAELVPARFGTGRDLFGINRICGGYYAGRARERGE